MTRPEAVQKKLDFHVKTCKLCQTATRLDQCCPLGQALAYLVQQVK